MVRKKKGKVSGGLRLVKKSPLQVKKDFEIYSQGIARLKELKLELKSLDIRGFTNEEREIRFRLKNVSDIPLIEKQIKQLRFKINNKHKPRRRKRPSRTSKEISEIKKDLPKIKAGISRLSNEMKEIEAKKRTKIDVGVGSLVEADFDSFLGDLKRSLSERVEKKEKGMDILLKADLAKREQEFRLKYADLARTYNEKKKKKEKQLKEKYKARVDSSLRKEVSEKFNRELKIKLEAEKASVKRKYQAALEKHAREELSKQKKKLEQDMNKRLASHKKSEQTRAQTEINQAKLQLDFEKKKEEVKLKLEKAGLRKQEEIFIKKKKSFLKKSRNNALRAKNILNRTKQKLSSEDKKVRQELISREKREKQELRVETSKLAIQESKIDKMKNELKAKELKLKKQFLKDQEGLVKEKTNFEDLKKRWSIRIQLAKRKFREKMIANAHQEVEEELAVKERLLRQQLQNEFNLKLKKRIQEHEEEIRKKKLNLELEIQKRMKEVLN